MGGEQTTPAGRPTAWDIWRHIATEEDLTASDSDKARMMERHKVVVNIIDVNSKQLRCESAIAGLDIERACAMREAEEGRASEETKSVVAALDRRMLALSDESQRLATQREFLNASLTEFDSAARDDAATPVGRA